MEEWFTHATPEERDAMSALQLDYQFSGDSLGSKWWILMQEMGFVHKKSSYELPSSAPETLRDRLYTSNELYERLDRFAIPQLWSPFQAFPPEVATHEHQASPAGKENSWWSNLRDDLIFRKYHDEVKGFKLPASEKKQPTSKVAKNKKNKGRSQSSEDAGAEIYMRKNKRSKYQATKRKLAQTQNFDQGLLPKFPTLSKYLEDDSFAPETVGGEGSEEELESIFDDWKLQSEFNFSLLFYGAGSKRDLLNRFASYLKADGDTIVIDGFNPQVTIEGIIAIVAAVWCNKVNIKLHDLDSFSGPAPSIGSSANRVVVEKAIGIAKGLARQTSVSCRPYYLIVHNIDAANLRNHTAQEALASLVSYSQTSRGLKALRVISSVDHINSPSLLWEASTWSKFQWHWIKQDTCAKYQTELSVAPKSIEVGSRRGNLDKQQGLGSDPEVQRKAIFNVLASLAPRHTESLKQLASLQAGRMAKKKDEWVQYKDLLAKCKDKCIVGEDNQLRIFLAELSDHGVVEHSPEDASLFSYKIPYPARILKQILDFEP